MNTSVPKNGATGSPFFAPSGHQSGHAFVPATSPTATKPTTSVTLMATRMF
jgi:hypothetical protein